MSYLSLLTMLKRLHNFSPFVHPIAKLGFRKNTQFRTIMTTATFKHIDTSKIPSGTKPWTKVDDGGQSFDLIDIQRPVHNISDRVADFTTDNAGFAVYTSPAKEKLFTDDLSIRQGYYPEVEQLLRKTQPGVSRVVIFDHTIRRRKPSSPRQPVQQVHVDQTPAAADARVRRHVPAADAERLLRGRYQIVNVWRPIGNPASDFPLAVVDWRSSVPEDFVPIDLMYPVRSEAESDDDRGKEKVPVSKSASTEGYEARGETLGVRPNAQHRFVSWKFPDMRTNVQKGPGLISVDSSTTRT